MAWLKIDDQQLNHPKFAALEEMGARMWADANALLLMMRLHCSHFLTDGSVTRRKVYQMTPLSKRRVNEVLLTLEQVGLIEPFCKVDDKKPVVIHDYLDWNPCREKVLAERTRKATAEQTRRQAAKMRSEQNQTLTPIVEGHVDEHVTQHVAQHVDEHVTQHVDRHVPRPDPDPSKELRKREQEPEGRTALFPATDKKHLTSPARAIAVDAMRREPKSAKPDATWDHLRAAGEKHGWAYHGLMKADVVGKLRGIMPIPDEHLQACADIVAEREKQKGRPIRPGGWPYVADMLVDMHHEAVAARNGATPGADTRSPGRGAHGASSRPERKGGSHPGSDPAKFTNGIVEF